ncbi:MAG: hypothetical protein V1813_03580 [Candidatus Aenigmatarchaeota archaeon]
MEFTFRTVIVMILLLIMALVCATIILGWSGDANNLFHAVIGPFRDMVSSKPS